MRLLFSLILPLLLSGPSTRTAAGEYIYYVPENISLEKAKIIAQDRCKMQILADEFGTVTGILSSSRIHAHNEKSSVEFSQIGESEVRGEWIQTLDGPRYDLFIESGILAVKVSLRGVVRELVNAPVDFTAKVLCNGTADRFERSDFVSGDELYLSFLSPVAGYLAVYLFDCEDTFQCLYPYMGTGSGVGHVLAGKRKVLFSKEAGIPGESVDEYTLQTGKEEEYGRIYIIFSPNKFTKAIDQEGNAPGPDLLPRELPYKEFQKWLSRCRKLDPEMRVEVKDVTIYKSR